MFISHTYKLMFFEVPRTGSRSITQALTQLDPRSPTAVVRAVKRNLHHYHVYDQSMVDNHADYSLIAVHRNPFDRLWSHYKYRKQYGNPDELKRVSFEEYLRWVCLNQLPRKMGPAMVDKPIVELLPCDRVDHWMAFDTLRRDWDRLFRKLELETPELPWINRSQRDSCNTIAYDRDLASLVKSRFGGDFDYFDYDKNAWKAGRQSQELR